MKLGKQIGLGPGHIVLDRDPAPLPHISAAIRPISTKFGTVTQFDALDRSDR